MAMLDDGEVRQRLGYHPATEATTPAFEMNRALAILVGEVWNRTLPPGREAALALTALQEALMWANAAVACRAGDDWQLAAVDVSELLDDVTELLEGPLHLRIQVIGDGRAVPGPETVDIGPDPARFASAGPVEPVAGAERVLRGDCLERVPGSPILRCELVAGHAGAHVRGNEVWS